MEKKQPPILCLGAARTGTASLMKALDILGYHHGHHGWNISEDLDSKPHWEALDRASDGTFPTLPTYRGSQFTRAEWDEIFGEYDAVSDVASFYAESLIPAYPDAKVILVERDPERWLKSASGVFQPVTKPGYRRMCKAMGKLADYPVSKVCFRMQQGWTRSDSPDDIVKNLEATYERHNKFVREATPEGQLLDFKLSDGWEPLCRFLGKEVPDVPFPHVNDKDEYQRREKELGNRIMKRVVKRMLCPCM